MPEPIPEPLWPTFPESRLRAHPPFLSSRIEIVLTDDGRFLPSRPQAKPWADTPEERRNTPWPDGF